MQKHTFQCPNCSEDIKLRLEVDFEKIKTNLVFVENCERGDQEGTIINLHPDFAIDNSKLHSEYVFPFLDYVSTSRKDIFDKINPSSFKDQKETKRSVVLIEEWENLKKSWSLLLNGQEDLAESIMNETSAALDYDDKLASVSYWIFLFSYRILNPTMLPLFFDANSHIIDNLNEKNISELERFRKYYLENLYHDHMERYFEIFSEYFSHYSEYSQLILYIKQNAQLYDNYTVSSNDFRQTKMFFGNAFEALTSNFVVLACLNNIINGRSYDKFVSMDLKKYLTINKANRANPFKDVHSFNRLAECLDSSLRNASHHGSVKFNKKKKKIVYRSGGTGTEKSITYTEYLMKCNRLLFSLAALLMIELLLGNADISPRHTNAHE